VPLLVLSFLMFAVFAIGVATLRSPHAVNRRTGFEAHDAVGRASGDARGLRYVGRYELAQVRKDVFEQDHIFSSIRRIHSVDARCRLDHLEDDETSGTYNCTATVDDTISHKLRTFRSQSVCGTFRSGPSDCEDVGGRETDKPDGG
jgi:hypothetical protein